MASRWGFEQIRISLPSINSNNLRKKTKNSILSQSVPGFNTNRLAAHLQTFPFLGLDSTRTEKLLLLAGVFCCDIGGGEGYIDDVSILGRPAAVAG